MEWSLDADIRHGDVRRLVGGDGAVDIETEIEDITELCRISQVLDTRDGFLPHPPCSDKDERHCALLDHPDFELVGVDDHFAALNDLICPLAVDKDSAEYLSRLSDNLQLEFGIGDIEVL